MNGEVEIDEADAASARIPPGCDALALANRGGQEVDDESLRAALAALEGIGGIRSLVVRPSSRLRRLRFLGALPALETLQLHGLALESLDGLADFRRGRMLEVDTGRNRRRDLARLPEAAIAKLVLRWARPDDLDAIGGSRSIRELVLSGCPRLPLERWGQVPIEMLSLHGGTIDLLADAGRVGPLRSLSLRGCTKLERFAGDNGNVTWMVVQVCKRLDVRSIASFGGLEFLRIVGLGSPAPLSAFASLGRLRRLALRECAVAVDVADLAGMTSLEELEIATLDRAGAEQLSRANPALLVRTRRAAYRGGRETAA